MAKIFGQLERAQLENAALSTPGTKGRVSENTATGRMQRDDGEAIVNMAEGTPRIVEYILNGDAKVDTAGWATYDDGAVAVPVDGTGGAPVVTWTRSTPTPLRGTASFLLTKDAVNRQGQGSSYDFTIDAADSGELVTVTVDYSASGGFTPGGTSDVQMFMYDVDGAAIVALSSSTLGTAKGVFSATFTATANLNYRLIAHVATVSAVAYTVQFDRFETGPRPTAPNIDTLLEKVVATYTTNAGQSLPNATNAIIDFEDVEEDDLGLVTTGAGWVFTADRDGTYHISCLVTLDNFNPASDFSLSMRFRKNGTAFFQIDLPVMSGFSSRKPVCCGTDILLSATDTLNVQINQNSGAARTLETTLGFNRVSIYLVK